MSELNGDEPKKRKISKEDLDKNPEFKKGLRRLKDVNDTRVPTLSLAEAQKMVKLSARAKRILNSTPEKGFRSDRVYELARLMMERDPNVSPDAIFVVLRASAWNKFKGRGDEAQRIWEAIHRAQGKDESELGEIQLGLTFTKADDLLKKYIPPPEWCVERIWQHGGWGFIAGEPKTYKSTFALDLAVSIATGTPFLNHFEVLTPGPVLIIQEENTEGIQQGRLKRILQHKGISTTGDQVYSVGKGCAELSFGGSLPIVTVDLQQFSFTNRTKRKSLENFLEDFQPELIIFDPIQRMMGDLSLRDEKDVNKALNWVGSLSKDYGAGVMLVHHYHKTRENGPMEGGQRMLGSQALHAWLMCGLYVSRLEGARMKMTREFRAFMDPPPFELEFNSDDDGSYYDVAVTETKGPRMIKSQDELIDLLQDRPWQTSAEYAKILGTTRQGMIERLNRLNPSKRQKKNPSGKGRPLVLYGPPNKTPTK